MVLMAVVTTAAAAPVLRISGYGGTSGGPLRVLPPVASRDRDDQLAALSHIQRCPWQAIARGTVVSWCKIG
jgi:hypothetical protein